MDRRIAKAKMARKNDACSHQGTIVDLECEEYSGDSDDSIDEKYDLCRFSTITP